MMPKALSARGFLSTSALAGHVAGNLQRHVVPQLRHNAGYDGEGHFVYDVVLYAGATESRGVMCARGEVFNAGPGQAPLDIEGPGLPAILRAVAGGSGVQGRGSGGEGWRNSSTPFCQQIRLWASTGRSARWAARSGWVSGQVESECG